MKNMLVKDTFRDIKKSRGRFISIFAIVALGVAFFAGIKQAPINMKVTADKYYDDYNLMDIRLVSTLGLTKEDEEAVKKIDGVLGAHATKAIDVLTTADKVEVVLKVHGLPIDNLSDTNEDYINRVNVVEGRLPEKSGECVIESGKLASLNLEIGSKITLSSGTDNDISESLQNKEYTVVGKVQTPYYLSFEKGSSSIGSGKVGSFIMIPESDFKSEIYTDIYLTVEGAKEINSYKDKYFDVVNKVTDELELLGNDRAALRYEEVHSKALEEFNKGKVKFEEEKKNVLDALEAGREKINNGKLDLDKGENELEAKKAEFNDFVATSEASIKNAEQELSKGEKEYLDGLNKFNEEKPKAEEQIKLGETQIAQAESALVYLKDTKKNTEEKLKNPDLSLEDREALEKEVADLTKLISDTEVKIADGRSQVEAARKTLNEAENNLAIARKTLDDGKATLESNKLALENGKIEANNGFVKAENDINLGKEGLKTAEEELIKQEELANEQLSIAEGKLKDAENAVNAISDCEWIVLDRNKHYSYVDYKSSADSIDKLARIFPVFFFLVAALVCLTTMTRMVDEQRTNIGTLKALGYSKGAIAFKFIVYALLASLGGSIVGLAIGLTVFPMIVFNAYSIMYVLPPMKMGVDIFISLGITLVAVGITTMAAMSACYKELVETPSILMRPKAPKNGKRIIIERIPFIWNRLNFTGKVTVRNLFRYKKRFFMTVFGIAGCTALILTGFGIKDSIKTIVAKQFSTINKYEMTVNLDKDLSVEEKKSITDKINSNSDVEKTEKIWSENSKIVSGDIEKEATIMVPKTLENFSDFITLQDRKTSEGIVLDNSGVVISEKLAKLLDVKVGDTVTVKNNKNVKAEFKITGVTENYTFHYIYIAPELYEEKFNTKLEYSTIIAKLNNKEKEAENKISSEVMSIDGVSGVSFNSGIRDSFDDTMKSLNYVVLVLIISAGGLAFVVLYNLTNVNISERIREIATIKVLGFYDNEVSAYIYRENIILTLIGTFVGLGLGVILHRFIMVTVEMENLMFGRVIDMFSYGISAFLTIFFAILVNVAMYYKLKNVEMVESLKSVD